MKLQSIKILTDENISPKVVSALRGLGLDWIRDKSLTINEGLSMTRMSFHFPPRNRM